MDKPVNNKTGRSKSAAISRRPSRAEAEDAVRTLIRWAGDDPEREGLLATPARVVRAYEEWFAGYNDNPRDYLKRTFEETGGYDEVVVLRDIRFESHCEHHLAPIIGARWCSQCDSKRMSRSTTTSSYPPVSSKVRLR